MKEQYKERFKNGVWGFVIGDALGVPFEFCTRAQMAQYPITEMVGYGTYDQPPGSWSDDTSMMLCMIDYFLEEGEKDKDYWLLKNATQQSKLARKFIDWYRNGAYTSGGELFDIGQTTRAALNKIIENNTAKNSGITDPKTGCGNGALMRCFPIAYFMSELRIPVRNLMSVRLGSITHNTSLSHHCCSFFIEMFFGLLIGYTKEEAYEHAILALGYIIRQDDFIEKSDLMPLRRLNKSLMNLSRDEIKSSGYVIHTLEAAIWCFLNTDNYQDAVFAAINLGEDTDTIGALTGALAGCYYGQVREDWKARIENKQLVEKLLSLV